MIAGDHARTEAAVRPEPLAVSREIWRSSGRSFVPSAVVSSSSVAGVSVVTGTVAMSAVMPHVVASAGRLRSGIWPGEPVGSERPPPRRPIARAVAPPLDHPIGVSAEKVIDQGLFGSSEPWEKSFRKWLSAAVAVHGAG
jgi:hypothetical protein